MTAFALFLLTLAGLYAAVLLLLRKGLAASIPATNTEQPRVSVIIAARNEEGCIDRCLQALQRQRYPKHKLEIIVVDDRSEDGTAARVAAFCQTDPNIHLLQIRESSGTLAPKKHAIAYGIAHASGDILFTTDADCQPGPCWVAEMVKYFEPEVGMVAGFNPYQPERGHERLFHEMLALDYFSMAAVAAACTDLDRPVSCSGGNLAYRRCVYDEAGGFAAIGSWVSGDDDLFLEHVHQQTSWQIRYARHPRTFVPTRPPETVGDFFNQRIRYASKCRHYRRPVTLTLVAVYLLNLAMLVGAGIALVHLSFLPFWLSAFGLKSGGEWLFLTKARRVFSYGFRARTFLGLALWHPLYLAIVGVLGQIRPFTWKGHRYRGRLSAASKTVGQSTELNAFKQV